MAHEDPRTVEDVLLCASLEGVLDALADWTDAKAEFRAASPEWRTSADVDRTRLELKEALRELLS